MRLVLDDGFEAFWDKNAVIGALYFGLLFIVSLLLVTSRRGSD